MYYIFASFVVGAVLGGSAFISQPAESQVEAQFDTTYTQESEASPIIDNSALSADALVSIAL